LIFKDNKEAYRLQQLTSNSHIGVVVVDDKRNNLYVNDRICEMFGYDKDYLLKQSAEIFHINHDSFLKFADLAFDCVLNGKPVNIEYQFKKKDGTLFWIEISGSVVEKKDEVLWIMVDITKRKKFQKELEDINYNMKQYLDAIDKIEIGLFVVNEAYDVEYMNDTMKKWFGDQTNKTCYSSVAGLDEPCPYCKLPDVIKENKKVIYEPITPDGQSFDIVATSIKNSDGTISKMEVIRNVTDQKNIQAELLKQKEELDYQAHHDALTGLPNRILFNDRLEHSIKQNYRDNTKMALLFIDLDHFKEINDSLGHIIGDDVLKVITKRLKSIIRDVDTISRLGGDEFTIIISNIKDIQDISVLARKILKIIAKSIEIDTHELYVSSSIGISLYPDDGSEAQNLIKYADAAMYKAKNEGRNNFQFYSSEMTELAFERVVMESSFRASLKNDDFIVYYQPQVDGLNDKIIGMEALVRWNHPSMGIVSPSKFIPLAESTGLIVDLDRYVMKTAMKQLSKWYAKGLNPGVLALNLSVKQLKEDDFIDNLQAIIHSTNCRAQWIELEVTEGQVMSNPEESIKILNEISSLGLDLAVDDFGTGYSSLSYLKKLPISKLKIDQEFVRELPHDEDDVAIAKAVIALAKSLNLDIIAEGVETQEQKKFLIENGCKNIQGYFYSRPMPADEIEELLLKDSILGKNA
jgi:diguanylate cyclase (GGDEF)-like protein/PAS domain S-box-containing protein